MTGKFCPRVCNIERKLNRYEKKGKSRGEGERGVKTRLRLLERDTKKTTFTALWSETNKSIVLRSISPTAAYERISCPPEKYR